MGYKVASTAAFRRDNVSTWPGQVDIRDIEEGRVAPYEEMRDRIREQYGF